MDRFSVRRAGMQGTRFNIVPQASFTGDRTDFVPVEIAVPPGQIGPGPSDHAMYTVAAIGKTTPYDGMSVLPPWGGPSEPAVLPGPGGHFDHLLPGMPGFLAANAYGSVRFVIDTLTRFTGPFAWHFFPRFRRLEISALCDFDNAGCGLGYLELGIHRGPRGATEPYALNLDVIAHEVAHLAVFAFLGFPRRPGEHGEFRAFHESMADLVAVLVAAHLDPLVDDLLGATHGNLYVSNELNRFAETSSHTELRVVCNSVRLSEFEGGWADEHDLSLPLTGAMFDILVELYQRMLVEHGVLDPRVVDLADRLERMRAFQHPIDALYEEGYRLAPDLFRTIFHAARDLFGAYLAGVCRILTADTASFRNVGRALIETDRRLTGGRYIDTIWRSFDWRGMWSIDVGPFLPDLHGRAAALHGHVHAVQLK